VRTLNIGDVAKVKLTGHPVQILAVVYFKLDVAYLVRTITLQQQILYEYELNIGSAEEVKEDARKVV
jgi:hypothetical protein